LTLQLKLTIFAQAANAYGNWGGKAGNVILAFGQK
jgi:hypothetical protein